MVRDENGDTYNPSVGTDHIGRWQEGEAYAVFATATTALSIAGTAIDPAANSISLREGWNWVPYLLPNELPVSEALASVQDDLVLVKDAAGRVYYPDLGIEDLVTMKPGEGYKLFVDKTSTLVYPSSP